MHSRAQVEFMSVEPKLCHQGAKQHNMVLQLTAVGSMGRPLWHQLQVVAIFVERVQAMVSHYGWTFATWARVGRLATYAYLLEAAGTLFSMVRASICLRGSRWGRAMALGSVRHCWQRAAKSACVRRALHVVHTHLFAFPMRFRTANTLLHAVVCVV